VTGIDKQNAAFWDELCGSMLARRLGITDASPESLRRFDEAYFGMYPYLMRHLQPIVAHRGRTLEIGLGYGTVSEFLALTGVDYHGLDIARGPVEMVRGRLSEIGQSGRSEQVVEGSALEIPWPDGHFDSVVSIGCLHHTGDLARSIREVHRVLAPGGLAMVMVYNRNSLRHFVFVRPQAAIARLRGEAGNRAARAMYDANSNGDAAPCTEFSSARRMRTLFGQFSSIRIVRENMDGMPRLGVSRERLLGWPANVLGLDLYVTAVK
jgi:SAM-dependent methyltransferase